MASNAITHRLRDIDLFKDASEETLRALEASVEMHRYGSGEFIVRQGERGQRVFVVAEGHVQVLGRFNRGGSISETLLAWLGPGDVIGELALLGNGTSTASCIAITSTVCLSVPVGQFMDALVRNSSIALQLLRVLAQRMMALNERLADSTRDPLTGLSQRRALAEFYERELAVVRRTVHSQSAAQGGQGHGAMPPMAVLLVDVAGLRAINERLGRKAGDEVLRAVAQTLSTVCRSTDFVARHEDDEFVVLLPAAGEAGAVDVQRRVQRLIASLPEDQVPRFDLRFGVALTDPAREQPLATLLSRAKSALAHG